MSIEKRLLRAATTTALALLSVAAGMAGAGCDVRCDPDNGPATCPDSAPHCVLQPDGTGLCREVAAPHDGGLPASNDGGDVGLVDSGPVDGGREPGGDAGSPDAGPACLSGAPCETTADCLGPCGGETSCFDAECTADGCAYSVAPERVCIEAGCSEGTIYPETSCGDDGSCSSDAAVSCDGYACAPDGASCRTSCSDGSDCADGYFCHVDDNTCQLLLADGEDCSVVGEAGCASSYCDGQRCCAGGSCCLVAEDCPARFSLTPTCTDSSEDTECQGTRIDAICTGHVCESQVTADDSGCEGAAHACPNGFAPVLCGAEAEQAAPVCPTSCGSSADCVAGYDCVGGECEPLLGLGAACGPFEPACQGELKCENERCCELDGAACCDASTESAACSGGLACNLVSYSCATSCVAGSSEGCASASDYCVDGSACAPKKSAGASCASAAECASGACVDGFCCQGTCGGPCEACSSALTGLADGTCGGITNGVDTGLCDANGNGCGGSSCRCVAGSCKLALGLTCSADDDCASAHCECADDTCSTRKCNAVACPACKYADASYADGTCNGNRSGNSCSTCGDATCECAAGTCLSGAAEVCASNGECASGNCECANATCTTKRCNNTACPDCKYDSSNYLDATCASSGTWTSPPCSSCGTASCQCVSGACKRNNGQVCSAASQCASANCECATADCSTKKCSAANCGPCQYNSNGDGTCEGTVSNYSNGTCASGQKCYGGSCTSPGNCSCDCFAFCDFTPYSCNVGVAGTCSTGFKRSENCSCGLPGCPSGDTCAGSSSGSCSCVPDN